MWRRRRRKSRCEWCFNKVCRMSRCEGTPNDAWTRCAECHDVKALQMSLVRDVPNVTMWRHSKWRFDEMCRRLSHCFVLETTISFQVSSFIKFILTCIRHNLPVLRLTKYWKLSTIYSVPSESKYVLSSRKTKLSNIKIRDQNIPVIKIALRNQLIQLKPCLTNWI